MQMELIVALVLVLPIILMMVVVVWYLNIGGISSALKNACRRNLVPVDTAEMELTRDLTEADGGTRPNL